MAKENGDLDVEIGVTLNRLTRQLAQAEARIQKTATKMERDFARANGRAVGGFGKANASANAFASGGLRNASLQLSQITQQATATGDPLRALAIQLPDLAIGLGTFGILAGAAAGALLPLAVEMMSTGVSAKDLKKNIDDLEKSVARYEALSKEAAKPLSELRMEYGEAADAARLLLEAQRDLEGFKVGQMLSGVVSDVTAQFGDMSAVSEEAFRKIADGEAFVSENMARMREAQAAGDTERLAALQAEVQELGRLPYLVSGVADEYGITTERAQALLVAVRELQSAATLKEQADASARLAQMLLEAHGGLEGMDDEARAVYESLVRAGESAATLAEIDISGGLGGAADEAERLAKTLGVALSVAMSLANLQSSKEYSGRGDDPRAFLPGGSGASYQSELGYKSIDQLIEELNRKNRSRGSRVSKDEREAAKIFDQTRTAAEKYAAEIEKLDDLYARGLITQDTYNRGVKLLKGEFSGLGNIADRAAGAIRSAFDGIFDDPAAALEKLGQQLLQMALYAQLAQSMPSVFGAGGIIPLISGARAAGGPVDANRAYLVGERGPEVVIPRSSGTVIPNHQLTSGSRSGGGTTVIVNNNSGQPVQERRTTGPSGQEVVEVMVGKAITQGRLDGQMGGRFGSKTQQVKR